jgi:ADP-ribose pyrophosphatase
MTSAEKTARIQYMPDDKRGRLISTRDIYQGKIVDLIVDEIEISGKRTIREVVRHPGGVVVLALTPEKTIPFVRQHRYPVNREILELPAGKIDNREDPSHTAARELEEETGFRAETLVRVNSFYSSPGFCDELLHFFFAPEVRDVGAKPEFDEHLEIEFYSLEEALQLIEKGGIQDAKTICAIYWLRNRNHEVRED